MAGLTDEFRRLFFAAGRRMKCRMQAVRRAFVRPRLPRPPDGRVRIHLGCGDIDAPGFINVDLRPASHVHHVRDVTDLSVFPDEYADLIYACHVLEHVSWRHVRRALWEWRRVLKPGGVLRLSVPDFDAVLARYEASGRRMDPILSVLLGSQTDPHDLHRSAFNRSWLEDRLREAGFREVRGWDPAEAEDHDFDDWAGRTVEIEGRPMPISLNLEAVG